MTPTAPPTSAPQPYTVPRERIEAAADRLLAAFQARRGAPLQPPVPVDDILELECGLTLCFDDLARVLGVADVLGATFIRRREVYVDESLDPIAHPQMRGRYHFTLAHELGHWELHRHEVLDVAGQRLLFPDSALSAAICRGSLRDSREREADYFACCLLMPRTLLRDAWRSRYGALDPWVFPATEPPPLPPQDPAVTEVLERKARELAEPFQVSAIAMRIRLEELKLLRREPQAELF